MALTYSSANQLGQKAPHFSLPGVDGKIYSLESFKNAKALCVIFMCNHCPYVIAVQDRINDLAMRFSSRGVSVIGINSNDSIKYPADNFENMKLRAREQNFSFPYLWDEAQSVARAYNAACTPDPYLYEQVNGEFILRYQGRIDDNWKDIAQVKHQDLAQAIEMVLSGKPVPADQKPSMGCNIKWRPH
jgi:peroxiredoxin